jgi:DNA polymerase sigma
MTNGNIGGGGTGGGQPGSAGSNNSGCAYETALVNSRRRIPYSVGSESLTVVHPGGYHARLEDKDERCLSVDIMDLYHVFSPPFISDLG